MSEEQIQPCPECGDRAGWWSAMKPHSMCIFKPNGEPSDMRIFYKKRKHCATCNHDITSCIKNNL
jgi:hypothetical protein